MRRMSEAEIAQMNQWVDAFYQQGQFAEAISLAEQVVELARKALIPDAEGEAPMLSEPKPETRPDYLVARFPNVPAGKYTLIFEPME